jgi:hypothetical protein
MLYVAGGCRASCRCVAGRDKRFSTTVDHFIGPRPVYSRPASQPLSKTTRPQYQIIYINERTTDEKFRIGTSALNGTFVCECSKF